MKVNFSSRISVWDYLSDFSNPHFFSTPLLLERRRYKQPSDRKFTFIYKLLEENKIRQLYTRLKKLYQHSVHCFYKAKLSGFISQNLHPVEEQHWFIQFLEKQALDFSNEELWLIILNHEQREKYVKYLEVEIDAFEIFLENYFLKALSINHIKSVFLTAYENNENDRRVYLEKLFERLSCKQTFKLLKALKEDKLLAKKWLEYCEHSLEVMRNSQIKGIVNLIPSQIEYLALQKLYPCEILEVIDQEEDSKKKHYLIKKVLKHYKSWWSFFPHNEIKISSSKLLEIIS